MQDRQNTLQKWLERVLDQQSFILTPLCGDASFRHYYRLQCDNRAYIVMDAPPVKENIAAFVEIASILIQYQLHAPALHAIDNEQGFILLEDFGDNLLLNQIREENHQPLYKLAIDKLILLQQCPTQSLPTFDKAFMHTEWQIFVEWFLQNYLHYPLSEEDKVLLNNTFIYLSTHIDQQPKVFIHRDYHSRNLMTLKDNQEDLGILDFQDAMHGPFAYDLVSLLKDCYIQWPQKDIRQLVDYFYAHSQVAQQWTLAEFMQAFELCGLQRHLKVLGIFSRLYLRDHKPNYLKDLPLTLDYVLKGLEGQEALSPFYQFMQKIRLP